jgi:ADP-ribose pyrophosphatase YjhB (NUDIX family)
MAVDCEVHRLVADVALFAGERVLMVKYRDVRRYDGQRGWFLPDDFLEFGEPPEAAGKRIAKEQTGLDLREVQLSHVESFGNGAWHLIFHFRADVKKAHTVPIMGNVAAAEWFDLKKLPDPATVAHHGWALDVLRTLTK